MTSICHICHTEVEDGWEHYNWHVDREKEGEE